MADEHTPDELGIGPARAAGPGDPTTTEPARPGGSGAQLAGQEPATDTGCQKADWLAETAELPAVAGPADEVSPVTERPATTEPATGEPATGPADEVLPVTPPTGGRVRRWGREYGGYVAAGALALAVLTCATTGLPGTAMTWHPGNPVADSSPSADRSPSAAAAPSPSADSPSPSPRRPTKRPAAASKPRPTAASKPRPTTSPTRSASPPPSPTVLGPADGRGLAAIVDDWCDRRYDRYAVLRDPREGAEDNWACRRWRRHGLIEADMTEVCVLRYGDGTVARYLDAEDPFSWRCYRG